MSVNNSLIILSFLIINVACNNDQAGNREVTPKETEAKVEELLSTMEQSKEVIESETEVEESTQKSETKANTRNQVDIKAHVKAEVLDKKKDALRELMGQSPFFNSITCCREVAKKECCCEQLFDDFLAIDDLVEKARIKKEDPVFNQICREQLTWFRHKIDSLDKVALAADDDW